MTLMLRAMFALSLAIIATTSSEARLACAVKGTADGYVALHSGPSARHPEVGKLKPQEYAGPAMKTSRPNSAKSVRAMLAQKVRADR